MYSKAFFASYMTMNLLTIYPNLFRPVSDSPTNYSKEVFVSEFYVFWQILNYVSHLYSDKIACLLIGMPELAQGHFLTPQLKALTLTTSLVLLGLTNIFHTLAVTAVFYFFSPLAYSITDQVKSMHELIQFLSIK